VDERDWDAARIWEPVECDVECGIARRGASKRLKWPEDYEEVPSLRNSANERKAATGNNNEWKC
jgi:hypothetical protein